MKQASVKGRARARRLRRQQTAAEAKLWQLLRNRQFDGIKFVRQQPVGPYIADFMCRRLRLIIELDGPTHDGTVAQEHDRQRTAWLEQKGYRVVRFANGDLFGVLDPVLSTLRRALWR